MGHLYEGDMLQRGKLSKDRVSTHLYAMRFHGMLLRVVIIANIRIKEVALHGTESVRQV